MIRESNGPLAVLGILKNSHIEYDYFKFYDVYINIIPLFLPWSLDKTEACSCWTTFDYSKAALSIERGKSPLKHY